MLIIELLILAGFVWWIIKDHKAVMRQLKQSRANGVYAEQLKPHSRKTAV